mmetsp:Transcript_19949/g.64949  ORF Transcript_19949/g.64949 Transcript_19949/m.64949 type:complete len:968 (-) Transcript_19949:89-2992(-)|eukprot:CAMPEP_0170136866 /NCGR_PEP_ID=MMETSP0033_2-20121228/3699_1 /TAXON_ID=195969 /ORGANISM="Dolichomastix tenuilepis, Strain CCMP3274" /LENGTH=967 /DNA_ID=CAMNT_0010372669 /DNA_START=19 /DNA_END=2922 /DNA_ORIENTATION=+
MSNAVEPMEIAPDDEDVTPGDGEALGSGATPTGGSRAPAPTTGAPRAPAPATGATATARQHLAEAVAEPAEATDQTGASTAAAPNPPSAAKIGVFELLAAQKTMHAQAKRNAECYPFYLAPKCDRTTGAPTIECILCAAEAQHMDVFAELAGGQNGRDAAEAAFSAYFDEVNPGFAADNNAKRCVLGERRRKESGSTWNMAGSITTHVKNKHKGVFAEYQAWQKLATGGKKRKQREPSMFTAVPGSTRTEKYSAAHPRQKAFLRLLTLFVVFTLSSFMIVDNQWFRSLIFFLDPMIEVPSRKILTTKLLSAEVAAANLARDRALKDAEAVTISIDLWMSYRKEDVLSVDAHYLTADWVWEHKHIALVSCANSTVGEDIAPKLLKALDEAGIREKLFCYVKDQGGNLSTAAQTLDDDTDENGNATCSAFFGSKFKPFRGDCYAHALNGACNAGVKAGKDFKFTQKDLLDFAGEPDAADADIRPNLLARALKGLKKAAAWPRSCSKGWHTLKSACEHEGIAPRLPPESVVTRFLSFWRFVGHMLDYRAAFTYLYSNIAGKHCSKAVDPILWSIASSAQDVLNYPSIVTEKSQHGHWPLSSAVSRLVQLFGRMKTINDNTMLEAFLEASPDDVTAGAVAQVRQMQYKMRSAILNHLRPFLLPLLEFDDARAHVAVGTMLDPRFADGNLFVGAFMHVSDVERNETLCINRARDLRQQYDDDIIIPFLVNMQEGSYQAKTASVSGGAQHRHAVSESTLRDGDMLFPSLDDGLDEMFETAVPTNKQLRMEEFRQKAILELTRFRKYVKVATNKMGPDESVFDWWRRHGKAFVLLLRLALAVLAIPASEIECERVFSLAGIVTRLTRNRMTLEHLDSVVSIKRGYSTEEQAALVKQIFLEGGRLARNRDDGTVLVPADIAGLPQSEGSEAASIAEEMLQSRAQQLNVMAAKETHFNDELLGVPELLSLSLDTDN